MKTFAASTAKIMNYLTGVPEDTRLKWELEPKWLIVPMMRNQKLRLPLIIGRLTKATSMCCQEAKAKTPI